jgi:type II secretory pathway predicted ATPase ExeA
LTKDELQPYLVALLKAAGVADPIFTPDAVEALFAFSGSLPRKVNSLAEKALLLGFQRQSRQINSDIIQIVQDDSELSL